MHAALRASIAGKPLSIRSSHVNKRSAGRTLVVTAALEPSSTFAIAQQAAAFAAVAGAEAAYTGTNSREGTPGLPQLTPTLVGCGGATASAVLIGMIPLVGCLTGLGSSGYMLYTYFQRFKDTPQRPEVCASNFSETHQDTTSAPMARL